MPKNKIEALLIPLEVSSVWEQPCFWHFGPTALLLQTPRLRGWEPSLKKCTWGCRFSMEDQRKKAAPHRSLYHRRGSSVLPSHRSSPAPSSAPWGPGGEWNSASPFPSREVLFTAGSALYPIAYQGEGKQRPRGSSQGAHAMGLLLPDFLSLCHCCLGSLHRKGSVAYSSSGSNSSCIPYKESPGR